MLDQGVYIATGHPVEMVLLSPPSSLSRHILPFLNPALSLLGHLKKSKHVQIRSLSRRIWGKRAGSRRLTNAHRITGSRENKRTKPHTDQQPAK
ncbi:hypothetical protein FKM82_016581 [Ascaphus truei]